MAMSKKDKIRFDKIDLIAYEMYKEGLSITTIAKQFNIKRQSLSKRLKSKFDIMILDNGKLYSDEYYFNIIDNSNKAYWLGMMFADGYVSKDNKIEFCLKESDLEHIKKFKKAIGSKHKIGKKEIGPFIAYRLSIQSMQLAKDLSKIGCVNNKSLICNFPKGRIKENLLPDFIRGVFDGDGSLYFDKRHNVLPKIDFSSGSLDFLQGLQDVLTLFNIDSKIYNGKTCYTLAVRKKSEAIKLLELMYQNSLYKNRLNRKYDLYTWYCRLKPKLQKV